jgi:transcriptional regulator with PAS, ATPase and Fis domain
MICESREMRRVIGLIERVASTSASIIITGESGTGKEEAARAIHNRSQRRRAPFVGINCAAIPESLVESQLFGHERGSFTGADRRHEGCFERANGGTLLLDEITEMRPEVQAKLLRVLEEHRVLRLGSNREIPIDVRVLAASNRSLDEAVRDGRLREDLYYRLAVFELELPPLRERLDDVPLLVEHFIKQFNRSHDRAVQEVAQDCIAVLRSHSWPGNVRQLRNVIEGAVILCRSSILSLEDLPKLASRGKAREPVFIVRMGTSRHEVERELIVRTLAYASGDKARTAAILGMSRGTLYNRLESYKLHETNGRSNGRAHRDRRSGLS